MVIETITVVSICKFKAHCSSHARNVALHQVAHENDARGLMNLKIQAFLRCNDGTIIDGALKNRNRMVCNVIESITVLNFRMFKAQCSSKEMLHQIK